ncbi:hypothetical protein MVEN_02553900 [Mycena venus]|uniref:Uncharacterized protein n=1 Tax=Mycena venus TaxID=2733690 RepID=A0A8H6WTT4_9AGAR|nr:hypothetical protein MVEN_02553900 [Mycena venus]
MRAGIRGCSYPSRSSTYRADTMRVGSPLFRCLCRMAIGWRRLWGPSERCPPQRICPGAVRDISSIPTNADRSSHGPPRRPPELDSAYHQPSHENYRATTDASTEDPGFHDLGWIAYVLPDVSATYYVHPTLRTTTDADLRDPRMLGCVSRALGYGADGGSTRNAAGSGMELWLRRAESKNGKKVHWGNGSVGGNRKGKGSGSGDGSAKGKGKGKWRGTLEEVGLARWWVDHTKREVSAAEDVVGLEDHLDMEYRYWAFMESHPAHAALPFAARREAMDVLTWAWTDRVLPPQQLPLPPPFTQNECQELLGLLRSFGDMPQTEAGIQSIVLTRIVSRILLRVAHWRQHHFRPHKALPVEPTGHHLRYTRSPGFMRRAADVLLSCLLLGVPYLFYTRSGYHRADAEGGSGARSLLPILIVGACTCLLAAVLLSASVTFLSLPGLHNIARVVALVVVLLAAGAMASGLVALFRYKAELVEAARPGAAAQLNSAVVGGEGLMFISTRSVIMSLPLVLLIYAVLGFVAAVVLYSFFGVDASAVRFDDYTRWAVLGVLGGLAGILTMSAVLLR